MLKFPLAINCILLSLAGCDQTPPPPAAVDPVTKSPSEDVSAPAPLQRTGIMPTQPKPESDSPLWEPDQEKQDFNAEEYAEAQEEALLNSPPSPSDWLDQIEESLRVGEPEEAAAAMEAFFMVYPDHPVDDSLVERISLQLSDD